MDAIKILGSLLSSGALSKGSGGNVLGNILGTALGGSQAEPTRGGGSLGDLLGSVLGGSSAGQSSGGGLGDILGSVLGGGGSSPKGGGLGDLLGSVLGGGRSSGGGLEELLKGGLGGLLSGAVAKHAQTINPDAPTPMPDDYDMLPSELDPHRANEQATLLIKAMINAAKADGNFDEAEQKALLSKLGDVTQEEVNFIQNEFNKPLDVRSFANDVPRGMENQIYALSLSAIDLDDRREARYLADLAQALRISPSEANQIHDQVGAPKIFS